MTVIARISNLLRKITVLVMVGLCVNTAVALDGSGTQEDPWLIQSLEDFNDFAADANYWAGFTRLETDVNLAGMVYDRAVIACDVNDSESGFQGVAFSGVFDGNDHKIKNLNIDGGVGSRYLGLFGYIDGDGDVSNLGLEGGSVSGGWIVGGLVGSTNEGTISKCYSTCDVNGVNNVGGLMGRFEYGSVSNCYSTGEVSGTNEAIGGLAGYTKAIVSNCYSTGNVNGGGSVGGLVGSAIYSSVSNCYSTGDVSGTGETIGGLTGYTFGIVSNCYSTGNVSGGRFVGGLMGSNNANVSNCYSTGDVNGGDSVGGLVGGNWDVVLNCFWDTDSQTHGVTESIGLNGGPVINVAGLPTPQMQTRSTFTDAGWNFINIWNIGENQTYPYLRVYLPSDINKDRIVNFLDFAITANQWMEEK